MNLFKFVAIFCASELMIVFAYPLTNDEPSRSNPPADEQSAVKNSQPETGKPSRPWADWADETSSSDPDEPAGGEPSLKIDEPPREAPPLKSVEHTTFKQPLQRQAQKTPTPWKVGRPPAKTSDGILGTSPRKMVALGAVRSKETHFPKSRLERITSPTVNEPEDQNSDASNNLNVAPRMMSWVSFKGVNASENSPVEQVREQETRQSSSSPPSTRKMSWADIAKGKSLDESSPTTPSTSPNTIAAMERRYSELVTPSITQVPETPQLDAVRKTIQSPAPAEILSLRPHTEPIQRNIQSPTPDSQMSSRGPSTEIVPGNTQSPKLVEKFAPASVMDSDREVPSLAEKVPATVVDSDKEKPSLTEKAPVEKAKESEKVEQNIDESATRLGEKVPREEAKESETVEQNIDAPKTSVKEAKELDKVQQNIDEPATKSPQKLPWADWAEMEGSDSDMDEQERNLMSFPQTAEPTEPTVPQAKAETILTKPVREPPKIKWSAAPPPTLGPRPSWVDLTRGRSLERTAPNTSTTEQQYPDVTRSNVRHPSNRPQGPVAPHQYGTQVSIPTPMATGRVQQPFDRIINEQSGRPAQHVGQREIQQHGSGRPSTAVPPNFSSIPWARIVNPNFDPVQPPVTEPLQRPAGQTLPRPEMENRRTVDDSGTSTIKKLLGIGTTAEAENSVTQSTGQQATTPVSSPMANRSVGDQTADNMVSTTPSKKSTYVPPFRRAVKDGSSSAENSPMKRPGEQGKMVWDSHSPPTTTPRTAETKVDTVKDMSFETEKSDEQKVNQQLSETIEVPVEESGPVEQNIAPEGTQSKIDRTETTPIEKLTQVDIAETESSPSETAEPNIEQSSQPEGTAIQKDIQSEVVKSPASPKIPFSEDAEPISQQEETIPLEQIANRSVAVPDMPPPKNTEPELQLTEAEPEQSEQEENQRRNDSGRFITIGGFKLFLVDDDEEETSSLDNVEPPIVETISEAAEKAINSAEDKPKESFNIDRPPTAASELSEPMQTEVTDLNLDSSQPSPSETPKTNIQPTIPATFLQVGDFELISQPSTAGIDGDELATEHTGQQLPPPVSSIPTTPQSSPSQTETAEQMIQKTSSPEMESDANRISKSVPFKMDDGTQPSPARPVTPATPVTSTTPVTLVTPAIPAKAKASPLASNANFHGAKFIPQKTFRDVVTGHTEEPQRISRTLRKRNKRKHKRRERKLLSPETPQEDSSEENSDEHLSAHEGVDSPLTSTSLPEAEGRMTDSREDTGTMIDSIIDVPEPVQENKDSMADSETGTPLAPLQENIKDSVPDAEMEMPASIKDDDSVIVSKTETPASSQVDEENVGPTDSKTGETEEVAKPPEPPPDILVNLPDSKLALKCPSKEIADDLESCLSEFKKFYDESSKTETRVVVLRNIPAGINERKLNFKMIGTYGEKPAEIQMVDLGKVKHALIRIGDILLEKIKNSPVLQFLQNSCAFDYCPVIELEDEESQSEPDEKTEAEKDSQSQRNSKAQKAIQHPKKPQPSEKSPFPSILDLSETSPPDSPSESSPTKSARRKMRAKKKKEALAELFAHARFGSASSSEAKAEGSSSNTGKEKKKIPTPQPSKVSQPKETIQGRTSVKLKETPQASSSSQNFQRAWSQPIPQPAEKSLTKKSPVEEVSRSLDAQKSQHRLPASPLGISQSTNESRQQKNLKNGETFRLKSPQKAQSAPHFEEKVPQNSQKAEQGPHQTPDESKLAKIPQPEKIMTHPSIQFGNLNLQPEGIHPALEVQSQETPQQSETIQEPTEEVETPRSARSSQPDSSEEALTPVKMSRTALKRMRQRKKKEEFEELLSDVRHSDSKLVSKGRTDESEGAEVPQARNSEPSTDKVGEALPSQNVEMLGQDETSPLELTIGKHKLLFKSNDEGDDVSTILEADLLVQLPDAKLFLKCPSKEVATDLQNCIAEFQKLYNESAKSSAHVVIIRDIASDLNDRKLKFKIMEKYKEKPDEVKIVSSSASQKKHALIQVNEALLEKMKNSPGLQFLQNQYTIENYPVVDRTEELAAAQPDESVGTSTPASDPSPAEPEPRENKETRKAGQRKKKKENILVGAPSAQDPLSNEAAARRWKCEAADWESIGQMLDENDGEGLSRSDRLIVLPKNLADDVFTELQNFIPYPRKYGVTVKRTVLFASNVAFVDCGSDAEALVLGEALKKSEKLLAYPATIFINEVWLHALPLGIMLDDIARSFRQKYGRGPLNIQFVPYKTKPKERLVRITVTETLLRDIRADPSINIEWINGALRRPIQVQHCANCWLFGHRTEKCPLQTLPANMRI